MNLQTLLDSGGLYDFFQKVIGDDEVRRYFIDHYVQAVPGQSLLDVACGTGNMVPYLPQLNYVGIDTNGDYIRRARVRFRRFGRFLCQSITDPLPPEMAGFDLALGVGILHHLSNEESEEILWAICDRLKPEGRFITLDSCYREQQRPLAYWLARLDRGKYVRRREEYSSLAEKVFSTVRTFDYCGALRIPVDHCVLICEKSATPTGVTISV